MQYLLIAMMFPGCDEKTNIYKLLANNISAFSQLILLTLNWPPQNDLNLCSVFHKNTLRMSLAHKTLLRGIALILSIEIMGS